jgi:membrane-bound lytic murein transglycosylase B
LLGATSDTAGNLNGRPEVEGFIDEMVNKHEFRRGDLELLFGHAQLLPKVVKAMSAPVASPRPWYQYRPNFLNSRRIDGGVEFWRDNGDALKQAKKTYGVPEEVVTAIIGVETRYGAVTGSFRLLDSLSTLAFDYPRRAEFFRQELENFLLLARDEKMDPLSLRGSYAGAMGIPQFMPGSFLRYAVDFDGDGRRNLWGSDADAIGSVANYLQQYGWQPGGPVAVPASVEGTGYQAVLADGAKPQRTVGELKKLGIAALEPVADSQPAALIALENRDGTEYWLVFNNFYVITRYNHSTHYAMAVFQLGREIAAAHQQDSVPLAATDR